MMQPSLFGGLAPVDAPWSKFRLRRSCSSVHVQRGGRDVLTGYIRPDGVYQRGVDSIKRTVWRGKMSYGVDEWEAISDAKWLVTVENVSGDWWLIDVETARLVAFQDSTPMGGRVLLPMDAFERFYGDAR